MHRRSASNYSLWPEQARPRRGKGLTLAAGGFAIGIACAIAANSVISDVINPPPDADVPRQVAVEDYAPIYATPVFPAAIIPSPADKAAATTGVAVPTPPIAASSPAASVTPAPPKPADADDGTKNSRAAARAPADVKPAANDSYVAGPSAATDGRGGDGALRPATLGALNPVLGTRRIDEEEPAARQSSSRENAAAPATTQKKKKKRPSTRARAPTERKKTRKSRRSSYAARHRAGPRYGSRGQVMSGGGGADY